MSARYSIVIPHYNIPDLLRRSLASIPHRKDVQIIVIDDCSSEQVLAELRKFENDFPYVQFVYSEENKGGGYARNVGLQHAVGKYLLFLDADDFFHDNINAFLDDYKDEDCDVEFFNADSVDSSSGKPMNRTKKLNRCVSSYISGKDPTAIQLRYLSVVPWNKMVKKELVDSHHIRFDEIYGHDDITFSYLVGYYAKKIKVDDRMVYCYTFRSDSISNDRSLNCKLNLMEVYSRKNRFMRTHHIPVFDQSVLSPIIIGLKERNWNQLDAFFSIAKKYGFSKWYILYSIAKHFVQCRIIRFFS